MQGECCSERKPLPLEKLEAQAAELVRLSNLVLERTRELAVILVGPPGPTVGRSEKTTDQPGLFGRIWTVIGEAEENLRCIDIEIRRIGHFNEGSVPRNS